MPVAKLLCSFLISLLVCVQPALIAQAHSEAGPIGIVDKVEGGPWTCPQNSKPEPLARGAFLFPGQTVNIEASSQATIAVVLFATGKIWEKRCTAADPCEGSYRPPQPASRSTGLLAYLESFIHEDTSVPSIFAASRSMGPKGPSHALLLVTAQQIDLTEALQGVAPGHYGLLLIPAGAQTANQAESEKGIPIDWEGTSLKLPAPASGLYALRLSSAGEYFGDTAAVLVVREDAERDQKVWSNVKAQTRRWTGVSPDTIDALLLATLSALPAH
jgi:hypothetical protein